jgi:hypothetical protein
MRSSTGMKWIGGTTAADGMNRGSGEVEGNTMTAENTAGIAEPANGIVLQ